MQIKRFEAADMTEALRMVKREFGDDAVILSAKEVRPQGFFSALKKRHVEITAATDYPTEDTNADNEFTGLLARQLDAISATDRVSLSTQSPRVEPTSTRQRPAFRPNPLATDPTGDKKQRDAACPSRPAAPVAASPVIAAARRHTTQVGLDKNAFSNGRRSSMPDFAAWCARPFYSRGTRQQIVAFAGPSGAGKSTALAKLAWHCRTSEKQRVGIISLDRYRMAANSLLERFARILNLPLFVVRDANELQAALGELASADTILLDTPGIGPQDRSMIAAVRTLLETARPDETHLVVNATVRKAVLTAAVTTCAPLQPTHILFTHLDEYGNSASILDLLEEIRLPSAFMADGVNLYTGLKPTTVEVGSLQSAALNGASVGGRITVFPGAKGARNAGPADFLQGIESARYLANRNSELFHDPDCKSVKRINTQNIIAFNSIEQALGRGFKPCRACCNADTIRKMVSEGAAVQRASAM